MSGEKGWKLMSKGQIVLSLPRKASRGQMLGAWRRVWATFYVLWKTMAEIYMARRPFCRSRDWNEWSLVGGMVKKGTRVEEDV